jgi:hypothetical protein
MVRHRYLPLAEVTRYLPEIFELGILTARRSCYFYLKIGSLADFRLRAPPW